jgi:subtilisin family serine protease
VLLLALAAPLPAAPRRDGTQDAARRRTPTWALRQQIGDDWEDVLVRAAGPSLPGAADALVARHGGTRKAVGLGWAVLTPPSGRERFAWYRNLQEDPAVLSLEPNYRALHPGCRQMTIDIVEINGRLDLTLQQPLERLGAGGGLTASGVTIAVIDSGVAEVPELSGRLLPAIDVLAPGASGLPHGRGASPRRHGRDDHAEADANGHGTAMASLIGAFAHDATILPVRVVGEDCLGTAWHVASGIEAAAVQGADVINVSLGCAHASTVLAEAVRRAQDRGALVIAASGNDGFIEYPAQLPGVVAVTAVGPGDWPAEFAATGPRIDLAAPGVDVLALGPDDAYRRLSGTSPAAALVTAGAAALVYRTPGGDADVRRRILRTLVTPTRTINPALEGEIGSGVLTLAPLR